MGTLRLRSTQTRRWWRVAAALAVVFMLLGRIAAPVSAGTPDGDRWVQAMVDYYSDRCSAMGGTSSVEYDMDEFGSVNYVDFRCTILTSGKGFFCSFWGGEFMDWNCVGDFTRLPETITHSVESQEGWIVEAGAGENPILTPTVILNSDEGGQKVSTRSVTSPEREPTPTPESGSSGMPKR